MSRQSVADFLLTPPVYDLSMIVGALGRVMIDGSATFDGRQPA